MPLVISQSLSLSILEKQQNQNFPKKYFERSNMSRIIFYISRVRSNYCLKSKKIGDVTFTAKFLGSSHYSFEYRAFLSFQKEFYQINPNLSVEQRTHLNQVLKTFLFFPQLAGQNRELLAKPDFSPKLFQLSLEGSDNRANLLQFLNFGETQISSKKGL